MNRIHSLHRSAGLLAGLAGALLALAATAPSALARVYRPPPGPLSRYLPCSPTCANGLRSGIQPAVPAHIHAAITGGMPGWQITLIAVGAALLGAAVTVLLERARAARRQAAATTA